MNSNVIPFVPKAEKATLENLGQFVEYCKEQLSSLGGDVDFYSDIWDISEWIKKKSDSHRVSVHFWNWENRNLRNNGLISMVEPFLSFVKSYLIYEFLLGATRKSHTILTAFRVLELSLLEVTGSANPIDINQNVLNHAVQILKSNYSDGFAYSCGRSLFAINKLASDYRLLKAPSFLE